MYQYEITQNNNHKTILSTGSVFPGVTKFEFFVILNQYTHDVEYTKFVTFDNTKLFSCIGSEQILPYHE